MARRPNEAHLLMRDVLKETGYAFTPEYRLFAERRWRYDWLCYELSLAVELHGATWQQGRHNRGEGFQNDRAKMNAAQIAGFDVLEFTTEDVLLGRAEKTIKDWLAARAR